MPKPVAVWNSARDVWETPQTEGFFCEHLDVFSETFPTSGMTASGVAYELPTWEPATPDLGSLSLLPTVTTQDGANNGGPSQFNRNTPPLNTRVLMLPTPRAQDSDESPETFRQRTEALQKKEGRNGGQTGMPLGVKVQEITLLPTPKASDGEKGGPNQRGSSGDRPLPAIAHLLPNGETTPRPLPAGNQLWEDVPLPLPIQPGATAVSA